MQSEVIDGILTVEDEAAKRIAEGEGRRMERDHRAGKQSQRAENADSCFFQKGVEFHWNHFFRINLLSIGSAV